MINSPTLELSRLSRQGLSYQDFQSSNATGTLIDEKYHGQESIVASSNLYGNEAASLVLCTPTHETDWASLCLLLNNQDLQLANPPMLCKTLRVTHQDRLLGMD